MKTLAAFILAPAFLLAALGCAPAPEPFAIEIHLDGFVVDGRKGTDIAELLRNKALSGQSSVVIRADAEVNSSSILAALHELDRLGVKNHWVEQVESPK